MSSKLHLVASYLFDNLEHVVINKSLLNETTMRRDSFFLPYVISPYVFNDFAKMVDGLGGAAAAAAVVV